MGQSIPGRSSRTVAFPGEADFAFASSSAAWTRDVLNVVDTAPPQPSATQTSELNSRGKVNLIRPIRQTVTIALGSRITLVWQRKLSLKKAVQGANRSLPHLTASEQVIEQAVADRLLDQRLKSPGFPKSPPLLPIALPPRSGSLRLRSYGSPLPGARSSSFGFSGFCLRAFSDRLIR